MFLSRPGTNFKEYFSLEVRLLQRKCENAPYCFTLEIVNFCDTVNLFYTATYNLKLLSKL